MAYTKQPARVMRIQTTPTFDATGATTAVLVEAFIQRKRLVNDEDTADVVEGPWKQVTFNLLADDVKDVTITAGGKTITYGQLAALMRKAAMDRLAAQTPVPPPEVPAP